MSQIPRLRSRTLFKKTTRSYFTDYNKLREAHQLIFKNELLSEERERVSNKILGNI